MKIYNNIHDAYLGTVEDVLDNYDYVCAPRGMNIYEKLDYTFRVLNPVNEPIITKDLERNRTIATYTQKELDLYKSGSNKVEDFAKASTFWNKISNPDGTINSAYGYLIWNNYSYGADGIDYVGGNYDMQTPWQWCVDCLKSDKDSRQAVLKFNLPNHFWQGNKDMTCTLDGVFLIRNDKLHLSITMRSNDLSKGLVFDAGFFISLIDDMVEELKPTYSGLTKGHYTHHVKSIHIYERDLAMMLKMIGRT
jgi:thymidylate synthase